MNIAISGSTCVGKTTLIEKLCSLDKFATSSIIFAEPFIQNPYINEQKETFRSQMFFYSEYIKTLLGLSKRNMEIDYTFYDRFIDEYDLISKTRYDFKELTKSEYYICANLADSIKKLQAPINKIIYLYCSSETIIKRQKIRGDKVIYSKCFIDQLNNAYNEWAKKQECILYVNTDEEINIKKIVDFIVN